ncbi:MAG TPA: hypothetical protein VN455_03700 [Methanotrichaceae archaeon]|nr:hypothetical protein [Methanotrichaceae archaeon]
MGSAAYGQAYSPQNPSGAFGGPADEDLSALFPGFGFDNTSPFNTQGYDKTFSFYSEYYSGVSAPIVGGIISTPVRFDISVKRPSKVYYGPNQMISYTQYASYPASSLANELWVTGATDWSRYVASPVGTPLQLVGYSQAGGTADFYEIVQTDTTTIQHRQYPFYPGYNSMSYLPDQPGRHILLFVANSQPSNSVIVDVAASSQQYPAQQYPAQTQQYPQQSFITPYSQGQGQGAVSGSAYYGSSAAGSSFTGSTTTSTTTTGYVPGQATSGVSGLIPSGPAFVSPSQGDVPVTIQTSLRGYDVYLDDSYVGKQTSPDGTFQLSVTGNQWHTVRVFDGENNYAKTMYFQSGVPKIINIAPATTVYY